VQVFGATSPWIGVAGALGGVALTGIIGLFTAVLNHRWTASSAREARRDQARVNRADVRRVAYANYLALDDRLEDALLTWRAPEQADNAVDYLGRFFDANRALWDDLTTSIQEVSLLAGQSVADTLESYTVAAQEYIGAVASQSFEFGPASSRLANSDQDRLADVAHERRKKARVQLLKAMREEQAADMDSS
jgi:hypothetical protein